MHLPKELLVGESLSIIGEQQLVPGIIVIVIVIVRAIIGIRRRETNNPLIRRILNEGRTKLHVGLGQH